MTYVTIYTDGACSGNPGPAGWAAILVSGKHEKEVVGGTTESTNNRAELMAVIVGLEALKFTCEVTIYTDSQYVIGALDLGWKRKANHDLLAQADALLAKHTVTFVKVNGHSGDAFNERADQLAKAEVERQHSTAYRNGYGEVWHQGAWRHDPDPDDPHQEDSNSCDRCYKEIIGAELKRAHRRSEYITYCDDCASQPQRVDFYLLPDGRIVVTKMHREGQCSIPLEEPAIVERDLMDLLAEYEVNGYTVRRWAGGARAWLGKPWVIRTASQIQTMRSRSPHSQLDFAYDG